LKLKVLTGQQLIDEGLEDELIKFDRVNMESILAEAGIVFPEEKRRTGLRSNPTFIMAFDGPAIVGYIEYLRSWNDADYIYVGSVQIAEKFRGSQLLIDLLDRLSSMLELEEFLGLEANVQKVNAVAVRLYRKIGFELKQNPANEASLTAKAGKELLTDSPIAKLIQRRRRAKTR